MKKTEDQKLIRDILGLNQFYMMNASLCSVLGVAETAIITYILSELEYKLSTNKNVIEEGIILYRKDIEKKFRLSEFQQRKIEKFLIELELITIQLVFEDRKTYNLYKVNLENIINLI